MEFRDLKAGDLFVIPSEQEWDGQPAKVYMKTGEGIARIISQTNRIAVLSVATVIPIDHSCIRNPIA